MDEKILEELKGFHKLLYTNGQNTDNVYRKVIGFVEELQFRRNQVNDYEQQVLQCFGEKHTLETQLKDEVKVKKEHKDEYDCKIKWLKDQRDKDLEGLRHEQDMNKLRVESLTSDVVMYQDELKKLQLEKLDLDIRLRNAENRYNLHISQRDDIAEQLANCKRAQEKLNANCQQYLHELGIEKELFLKATNSRDKILEAFNQQADIVSWLKSNQNKLVKQIIILKKERKGDLENVNAQKNYREVEKLRKELAKKKMDIFCLDQKVLELTQDSARNSVFLSKMSAQLKRSVETQNLSEKEVENMKEEIRVTLKELENVKNQLKNERVLCSIQISRPNNLEISYLEKGTQTMVEEIVLSSNPESNLFESESLLLVNEGEKESDEKTILELKPQFELPEDSEIHIFHQNCNVNVKEDETEVSASEDFQNYSEGNEEHHVEFKNSKIPKSIVEEEITIPREILKQSSPITKTIGNIEVPALLDAISQEISKTQETTDERLKSSTPISKENENVDAILKEASTYLDEIPKNVKFKKELEYDIKTLNNPITVEISFEDTSETTKILETFVALAMPIIPIDVEVKDKPSNLEHANHLVENSDKLVPTVSQDFSKPSTSKAKDTDFMLEHSVDKLSQDELDVKSAKATNEMELPIKNEIGVEKLNQDESDVKNAKATNEIELPIKNEIGLEKFNQMSLEIISKEPRVPKVLGTENSSNNTLGDASFVKQVLAPENQELETVPTGPLSIQRKTSDTAEIMDQDSDDVEVIKVVGDTDKFSLVKPIVQKQPDDNEPIRKYLVDTQFKSPLIPKFKLFGSVTANPSTSSNNISMPPNRSNFMYLPMVLKDTQSVMEDFKPLNEPQNSPKKPVTSGVVSKMANFRKFGEISSTVSNANASQSPFFVPSKAFLQPVVTPRKLTFESPSKKPKMN